MAGDDIKQLDSMFQAIGEFKRFSILQYVIISLSVFSSSYQLLSNVFICQSHFNVFDVDTENPFDVKTKTKGNSRSVPHRCSPPSNGSSPLVSGLEAYGYDNLNVSYGQCRIVVSYNDTVLRTEGCIYGMAYDVPKDRTAVSQFDLVCDYSSLCKLSQTLVIAGQGVGAVFFTIVSDRYGRKPVVVFNHFLLLVSGLIIAYAPNYTIFAIFKFCAGAFQQGCVTSSSTITIEMMTTRKRRIQLMWSGVTWGVCTMSLALWAYLLRDHSWRTLQMALSLSSLSFIVQLLFLKESLRWLIANGKSKAIIDYLRCATNLNKTTHNFEDAKTAYERYRLQGLLSQDNAAIVRQDTGTKRLTLFDILKIKRLFLNSVIMWLAWFTTALTFFTVYMSSTTLAGDPYLNFFLTALMEVPNSFVIFFLLNRLGRKITFNIAFIIVSVGIIMSGVFKSFDATTVNSVMTMMFSCVAMSGASGAFAIVYFYTPEIVPTNVRNSALGVSSLMGRIGGMIGPFTGVLSEKAQWAPGVLIGCLAFVLCLLSVFLPETRGRELPQTIADVKAWYSKPNANILPSDKTKDNKVNEAN